MSKSKACVIKGYTWRHRGRYYVNCETTNIENIWTTMVPDNYDYDKGEPTPMAVFESVTEANTYLKKLRHDTRSSGEDIKWFIERLNDENRVVNHRIRLTPYKT